MARITTTSAVIDNILRLVAAGGTIAVGLALPGLLIALDKPLQKYMNKLDKRDRERELRRIASYMRTAKLIEGSCEHGLQITVRGRKRLLKAEFDSLVISKPKKWDGKWRLVLFDIPESKAGRDALSSKLKELKFKPLQKSVWVHPFPCREIIETVSVNYQIDRYVTYVETSFIDNQKSLIAKFDKTLRL